ncbi:MAG: rhomboid family intramembrane serine protease [Candidatus Bathyarchaeota archaeon]|nr:rhomboid family intramembrane serine protease [Candidatus Bathyarchaeota archaeon]
MRTESRRLYERLETGFTIVFLFFLLVLTLSVMVFVADMYSVPGLKEILAVSPRTPWGIVTSLFVHADEAHLLNNMIALFLFLMLLVASNMLFSKEEIKRRIRSSLLAIFPIPVALNLSLIFLAPEITMIGSSGIVYTLEGTCLGFCLLNALELRKIRKYDKDERKTLLASALSNLMIFAGFVINLLLSPEAFLGSQHETIMGFHGISFAGGFVAALFYMVGHQFNFLKPFASIQKTEDWFLRELRVECKS